MKKIVTSILFLVFLYQNSSATDYYISSSGNDSNTGTSAGSPLKTITKLNTILTSLLPGDQVLFNCGDIFEGEIVIPSGIMGNISNSIIFSSYGSGNKPIISGSTVVATWTSSTQNIWQASVTSAIITQVFENRRRLVRARTPNTGYYKMGTLNGNAGFTDNTVSKTVNFWKNASLRFHLNEFWWEDAVIDSSSVNGYLGFTYETSSFNPLASGSGYFIENKLELLDTLNEWFFDTTNKILYLYSLTDPSTNNIRASVCNNGLSTNWPWVNKYITVKNIEFRDQAQAGISLRGSVGLIVDSCTFFNMGQYAIQMSSDYNSMSRLNAITNNYIKDCISNGIYTFNISKSQISHNTIKNSGLYPSGGGASEACGQSGMRLWFGDSLTISYNKIDSSGNCGIDLESSYSLVEKNIVDHSMLLLSDGAAIYNNSGGTNIYRNNILKNTQGNMDASPLGTARYTKELYFDAAGEHNSIIENNTFLCGPKVTGIGLTPYTSNLTIRNNTVYKCFRGLEIFNYDPLGNPVAGLKISKNVFYSNWPNGHPYYVNAWNGLSSPYTTCDSNYLCNPYSTKLVEHQNASTTSLLDFFQWKASSHVDANSKTSFYQWTYPTDSSFILINESDSIVKYKFSKMVLDLDDSELSFIVLPPFSSKVLIGSASIIDTLVIAGFIPIAEPNAMLLFPNPIGESLTVQLKNPTAESKIEVLDFTGKLVFHSKIQSNNFNINMSSFKDGVYLIKIGTNIEKIIVQH